MVFVRNRVCVVLVWTFLVTLRAADLRIEPGALGSGKAYVRCSFDGAEQICFVDTGSAMTLLPAIEPFTRRRNLGRFRYKSASGKIHEAETIEIGVVGVDGKTTRQVKVGRLATAESEATLGMDVLGRVPFLMEFRTVPKLRVAPKRLESEVRELRVLKSGLMALPISFGANETFGVWDTGASVTAVDAGYVRANPQNFKRLAKNIDGVDGTGEKMRLELFRAKELRIGSRGFKNLPVVVLDLTPLRDSVGSAVQAVIGLNAIRKADWYFDRAAKRWSVR